MTSSPTSPTTTTGRPVTADRREPPAATISSATSPARRAFDSTSSTLARSDSPPELSWKYSSSRGVTSLPCTPSRSSTASPSATSRSCSPRSTCRSGGQRVGEHDAGGVGRQPVTGDDDRRCLRGRLDPPRHLVPGVGEVEAGEGVRPVAEHRHRQRLEVLQRARHVEDRLHAGAHDEHRRRGDDAEVGRHVEGRRRAAVHPAEPAGREDADAGEVRDGRRRGHGRGAVDDRARRRRRGRASTAWRCRGRCRPARARPAEPDVHDAAEHRDRRRHRAARRARRPRSGRRSRCCRGAAARGRGSCSRGRRRRAPPRGPSAPPPARRRGSTGTGEGSTWQPP